MNKLLDLRGLRDVKGWDVIVCRFSLKRFKKTDLYITITKTLKDSHLVFLPYAPGKKIACGTVCLSASEASYVSSAISSKLFGMARNQEINIQGFPNFDATLADLKQFQKCPTPDYSVCLASGNSLAIREALIHFWVTKHPEFAGRMQEIVKKHDSEFNQSNLKRGMEQDGDGGAGNEEGPPTKKLRLSQAKTMEELEKDHPEQLLFIF